MAKDYKSRAHPPSKQQQKKKQQKPGWIWFVAGLLVGVFVSGLVWLKLTPSGPQVPQQASATKQRPVAAKSEKAKQPETPKPRFDFYTILPEMEVVVPDPVDEPAVTKKVDKAEVAAAATPEDSSVGYMLQMGSFRKYGDADRLKASLALVGIQAEIQRVNIKGGDVFHRVRSGPYGRAQVNALRAKLKQKKISSLVIKYRK
jgi:cell division protein FtsN